MAKWEKIDQKDGSKASAEIHEGKQTLAGNVYWVGDKQSGEKVVYTTDRQHAFDKANEYAGTKK